MDVRKVTLTVAVASVLAVPPVRATPTWEKLDVAGPEPSPRRGVAGIHDSVGDRLIFQGAETTDIQDLFLRDVWFFDLEGNAWTQSAGATPEARCHHTFVVDGARARGLLFGGFPRTNKLWSWDLAGKTWTDMTPAVGSPPARCLHSAVISPSRGEMIVYGGLKGGVDPVLSDTWSYELAAGSWTMLTAESGPGERYGHVAVVDESHDRMVVFGGLRRDELSGGMNEAGDLWAFDLFARSWTALAPSTEGPSPRQFARGATLRDGSGMVLFGGYSDSAGYMNDLWLLRFDALRWTRLEPEGSAPPPRYRHTLVLDETGDRLWVAFGDGESGAYLADIWTLDLRGVQDPAAGRFRRGDCNDDGSVDLSDAICILGWLFTGAAAPGCVAATNTNGDADADMTDATHILEHLFLGGPAPIAPFPECGHGTLGVDRELGCEAAPRECP